VITAHLPSISINRFKIHSLFLEDMGYDTITEAVESFKAGNFVVIVDETRECEADLVLAAEFAREDKITFMVNNTTGIITIPLTEKRARELELPLMVQTAENSEKHCTNFTVSVDAINDEMTTGVSSKDRTRTILTIVSGKQKSLARPGHIFPLIAKDSLLQRQGHTEASITLCRLAGLREIAVICELLNKEEERAGTMMNKEEAFQFARSYNLKIISIQQLIDHLKE